jgi:hypothetical protein
MKIYICCSQGTTHNLRLRQTRLPTQKSQRSDNASKSYTPLTPLQRRACLFNAVQSFPRYWCSNVDPNLYGSAAKNTIIASADTHAHVPITHAPVPFVSRFSFVPNLLSVKFTPGKILSRCYACQVTIRPVMPGENCPVTMLRRSKLPGHDVWDALYQFYAR